MQDKTIAERVARMEKDLVAMKTSQPIGSNSVTVYDSMTNFIWDYEVTMTADNLNFPGGWYGAGFFVKFIARNQSAPFASIRILAEVNGAKYNPLTVSQFVADSPGTITIYDGLIGTGNLNDYTEDNTVRWEVGLDAANIGATFKLKVIVTATDMGRLVLS